MWREKIRYEILGKRIYIYNCLHFFNITTLYVTYERGAIRNYRCVGIVNFENIAEIWRRLASPSFRRDQRAVRCTAVRGASSSPCYVRISGLQPAMLMHRVQHR